MAGSDVKAKRVTGTGAVGIGRARIRGISVLVSNAGAGRFTVTDGNVGATLLDVDLSTDLSHNIYVPDEGILSASDPYVSAVTNVTAATIFFS